MCHAHHHQSAELKRKESMRWISRQCAHLFSQLDCKETEARLVHVLTQQHVRDTQALHMRIEQLTQALLLDDAKRRELRT